MPVPDTTEQVVKDVGKLVREIGELLHDNPNTHLLHSIAENLHKAADQLERIQNVRLNEELIKVIHKRNSAHPCERQGCTSVVEFDDEPCCFEHSPDSGSSVPGYSYKRTHQGE